jgi:hypothetical protein
MVLFSGLALLSAALPACADLLDLPADPRLAPDAPGAATQGNLPEGSSELVAQAPGISGSAPGATVPGYGGNGNSRSGNPAGPETPAAGLTLTTTPPTAGSGAAPGVVMPAELADAGAAPVVPVVDAGFDCRGPGVPGPERRCYRVQSELLPWEPARAACQALGEGWDLVSIHSAETNLFVSSLASEELWIGGGDDAVEATWRWVDDGAVFWRGAVDGQAQNNAFIAWNPGEPNGNAGSNCARLVPARAEWADLECSFARAAVCAGPPL